MEKLILEIYENGKKAGEKDITHTPIHELEATFKVQEMLARRWEIKRIKEAS